MADRPSAVVDQLVVEELPLQLGEQRAVLLDVAGGVLVGVLAAFGWTSACSRQRGPVCAIVGSVASRASSATWSSVALIALAPS